MNQPWIYTYSPSRSLLTSLSTRPLWVFPVHQVRAPISCNQPGLVICFTLDNKHDSMLFSKIKNASRICVSSLRRGHANLLCILPILVYVLPKRAPQLTFYGCAGSSLLCAGFSVVAAKSGSSVVGVCGLLVAVVSLVAEHRLLAHRPK